MHINKTKQNKTIEIEVKMQRKKKKGGKEEVKTKNPSHVTCVLTQTEEQIHVSLEDLSVNGIWSL